jgi:hypothetical protein
MPMRFISCRMPKYVSAIGALSAQTLSVEEIEKQAATFVPAANKRANSRYNGLASTAIRKLPNQRILSNHISVVFDPFRGSVQQQMSPS